MKFKKQSIILKQIIFSIIILIALIPKVSASVYLDASFGIGPLSTSKNSNDIKRVYYASRDKVQFNITNESFSNSDTVKEDNLITTKLQVKISNSNNISCKISNDTFSDYEYSNNTYTLIEETKKPTLKGKISCSLPTTSTYIKASNNLWLTIELQNTAKDSNDSIHENTQIYRFNFGVINQNYLDSLYNEPTIEKIFFDGQELTMDFAQHKTNKSSIKVTVDCNENANKNKIMLNTENAKNSKEIEIKSKETTIDLEYGLNAISLYEKTELAQFIDSLREDAEIAGLSYGIIEFGPTFYFNREDNRSKINTLSTLNITNVSLDFKPNIKNYIATVPYQVNSVTIFSTLTDSKSTYVKGYGNRTVELQEGLNNILVKVKAENDTEATYSIKITREASNDSSLKSLSIDGKNIPLTQDVFIYNVIVDNIITNPQILAEANDKKAKIEIDKISELQEGSNNLNIIVTAPNGNKSLYLIEIIRDKLISTNSKLKNITIAGYELNFSIDKSDYALTIEKDVKKLTIEVNPEHEKATYIITGNKDLTNNSVIKIKVTAEDGITTSTYQIKINKETSNNLYLLFLLIPLVAAIITIIIIIKKKKNNNHNQQSNNYEDLQMKGIN